MRLPQPLDSLKHGNRKMQGQQINNSESEEEGEAGFEGSKQGVTNDAVVQPELEDEELNVSIAGSEILLRNGLTES